MTKSGSYTLKIILTDWNDTTKFAFYNTFIVSGEDDKYRLKIGGYSGYPGMLALPSTYYVDEHCFFCRYSSFVINLRLSNS